jgi:membrane protein implicated in regulation of membrane protease activity
MNAEWLLHWWNLIFLLPFGLALLYLALYTLSGVTFGDGDLDHSFDADHDLDADHELSADVGHDLDAGHDMDTGHDAGDSAAGGHGPGPLAALGWLGVGRVPLSILLMVLLLTWGVVGFVANAAMEQRGASAAYLSVPLAAALSLLMTRLVVTLVARYLPLFETTARRRHELLGSVGEAIFPIDRKFGMVMVRDDTGDLYQVPCRVAPDADPIPKGVKVQLIVYNAKLKLFYVAPPVAEAAARQMTTDH